MRFLRYSMLPSVLLPFVLPAQSTPTADRRIVAYVSGVPGALAEPIPQAEAPGSAWFDRLTAGLAAFGGNGNGAGMELGTLARLFRVTIREEEKELPSPTATDPNRKAKVIEPTYVYFAILNRASVNLDSLKNMATDYVTSLQPSPLTFRLYYDVKLTNRKTVQSKVRYPDVSLVALLDGRGVPFAGGGGATKVGGSVHGFATLKAQLKTEEIENGQPVDIGATYVEPSFYIAAASRELAQSLFEDGQQRALMGIDLRGGYRSTKDHSRDFGFVASYTWQKLAGAQFRIGAQVTK